MTNSNNGRKGATAKSEATTQNARTKKYLVTFLSCSDRHGAKRRLCSPNLFVCGYIDICVYVRVCVCVCVCVCVWSFIHLWPPCPAALEYINNIIFWIIIATMETINLKFFLWMPLPNNLFYFFGNWPPFSHNKLSVLFIKSTFHHVEEHNKS